MVVVVLVVCVHAALVLVVGAAVVDDDVRDRGDAGGVERGEQRLELLARAVGRV